VRSVNTPILNIDDKTFNNPVTLLDAWANYFEDLATPPEQQSFDSTFLMLVNDDVQSKLGRAKFFLLFSHIFIIYTFPIVYVTFLLPFPVVKFSLFHD
jgi:hypothetical protein